MNIRPVPAPDLGPHPTQEKTKAIVLDAWPDAVAEGHDVGWGIFTSGVLGPDKILGVGASEAEAWQAAARPLTSPELRQWRIEP